MDSLFEYAKSLNSSDEIIQWLSTTARKALKENKSDASELEHIIDWMNSSAASERLRKMSIKDAKRLALEWMERNKAKGRNLHDSLDDIEDFMSFKDGSKIVKLKTKKAFEREGFMMSHCLGGYSIRNGYDIYSLRDGQNQAHATFEISKNNDDILQIKGKGNGPIHPKYIDRVLDFLKKIGMNIRSSEMVNLGYYLIHTDHLNFVRSNIGKNEIIVELAGDFYLV